VTEFTGERVIPGQVNNDLWAEHLSRYEFAARFAAGRRVLDVGCGTGYGSGRLAAEATSVAGLDPAHDAIDYARTHYPEGQFLQASAIALPFATAAFDIITAFEVIEHLSEWRLLLSEARRTLAPGGIFLVSTPNKLYYTESRAEQGPNPYHHHEFEFEEFRAALADHFDHVAVLLQNRLDAIAFYGINPSRNADSLVDGVGGAPSEANFFIGVCSDAPLPPLEPFVYVPKASNLLRERERHIALLEVELAQIKQWLDQTTNDRDELLHKHAGLQDHLDKQNRWALELQGQLRSAQDRIAVLQDELQNVTYGYQSQVADLEKENAAKTQWALDTEQRLTAEIQGRTDELREAVRLLDQAEATVNERTEWAQELDRQTQDLTRRLEQARQSRWIRLGRMAGLGPRLEPPPAERE
jgi:SAM-dependent methyltransferase